MHKKVYLDKVEQDIEDNYESLRDISNMEEMLTSLKIAASNHIKKNKSITIRIKEMDLEAMKIKASKLGMPYQTYINMLIHKDAVSGL